MIEPERAIDVAMALFGVPIRPEWREAAVMNFVAIAAAAELVLAFELDDEADYGPVFQP